MKISKTALFGGALMTAGIANAAEFEFTQLGSFDISRAQAEAYDSSGNGGENRSYGSSVSSPEALATYLLGDISSSGLVTRTVMSAYATTGASEGDSTGSFTAVIRLSADTEVFLDWSFVAGNFATDARIFEYTDTGSFAGTVFDHNAADGLTGSRSFVLEANTNYFLLGTVRANDPGETAFVRLGTTPIPAPGAAALAGLAGLAAVRRRR